MWGQTMQFLLNQHRQLEFLGLFDCHAVQLYNHWHDVIIASRSCSNEQWCCILRRLQTAKQGISNTIVNRTPGTEVTGYKRLDHGSVGIDGPRLCYLPQQFQLDQRQQLIH